MDNQTQQFSHGKETSGCLSWHVMCYIVVPRGSDSRWVISENVWKFLSCLHGWYRFGGSRLLTEKERRIAWWHAPFKMEFGIFAQVKWQVSNQKEVLDLPSITSVSAQNFTHSSVQIFYTHSNTLLPASGQSVWFVFWFPKWRYKFLHLQRMALNKQTRCHKYFSTKIWEQFPFVCFILQPLDWISNM